MLKDMIKQFQYVTKLTADMQEQEVAPLNQSMLETSELAADRVSPALLSMFLVATVLVSTAALVLEAPSVVLSLSLVLQLLLCYDEGLSTYQQRLVLIQCLPMLQLHLPVQHVL